MEDIGYSHGYPERRDLTVLECDLVGSTHLANNLDPEDLSHILVTYQDKVVDVIKKHGGYFAQFAGDAVWAYFGYPTAREDETLHAIRSGLEIASLVRAIKVGDLSLDVRIGIASGLCVVGNFRHTDNAIADRNSSSISAIGDPPNLAARIQSITTNGSVAISNATREKAGGAFEYEDLGFHNIKGFESKIRLWRVISEHFNKSRFKIYHQDINSSFIGRQHEIDRAAESWNRALTGQGQTLYILGESGIGKSRLVTAIANELHDNINQHLWLHSLEHLKATPYSPIVSMLSNIVIRKNKSLSSFTRDSVRELFSLSNKTNIDLIYELLKQDENKQPVRLSKQKQERILCC